jgi:hypothetical protein
VVHVYLAPAAPAPALVGVLLPPALALAPIWVGHIALDRVLGYGMKLPSGSARRISVATARDLRSAQAVDTED